MRVGQFYHLQAFQESTHGMYLGAQHDRVLLPNAMLPKDLLLGDTIKVFVHTDSEDRIVATTKTPYALPGQFALLQVTGVNAAGAFFAWGLDKDLFCPRREMKHELLEGERYMVRIYVDDASNRVACSTRITRYLKTSGHNLQAGDKITGIISELTEDWVAVIINDQFRGSIFNDERLAPLKLGQEVSAYVKKVREDGQVALSLRPQGYHSAMTHSDQIIQALQENNGQLNLTDKSDPAEIFARFGLSKSAYKKVLGTLFREEAIEILPDKILLKRTKF